MPHYGEVSLNNLSTCTPGLKKVFKEVIKKRDCSILCGYRPKHKQDILFKEGKSKVEYPDSKHNFFPSRAIDVAPYPIDWKDIGRFYMFAGYVLRVADELGVKIRFGGDWNRNTKTTDQNFNDLVHFEEVI